MLSLDTTKMAIGGSSAGGNLAAIMTHKGLARGIGFTVQLLVVPVTDNTATVDTNKSYKAMKFTAALPAEKMIWYRKHYLPNEKDWANPEASPIFFPKENFANLPPAVFIVGELDVLRSEAEQYAEALEAAGVKQVTHVMGGMPHPFLAMDAVLEAGKRAIDILCESLITFFSESK